MCFCVCATNTRANPINLGLVAFEWRVRLRHKPQCNGVCWRFWAFNARWNAAHRAPPYNQRNRKMTDPNIALVPVAVMYGTPMQAKSASLPQPWGPQSMSGSAVKGIKDPAPWPALTLAMAQGASPKTQMSAVHVMESAVTNRTGTMLAVVKRVTQVMAMTATPVALSFARPSATRSSPRRAPDKSRTS